MGHQYNTDMTAIYLLLNDETEVHWSFDKEVLTKALNDETYYCCNQVIEVSIPETLAEKLRMFPEPPFSVNTFVELSKVGRKYYQMYENKGYVSSDGDRLYIIFESNGRCAWCPSGNNLNQFYKKYPERYLGEAIRVPLTKSQYVKAYAYLEFCIDNF